MKSFKKYLIESKKYYNYRIKTVEKITENHKDLLEKVLEKYEPVEFIEPVSTILQKNPLDFYGIENKNVYIIDVTLNFPINPYHIRQALSAAWRVPEQYVIIKGENDPLEIEGQKHALTSEMEQYRKDNNLEKESKLSTESVYPEHEHSQDGKNFYGNEYNSKFLEKLAEIARDRKENRVNPPSPLFDWLKQPENKESDTIFNNSIEDAPQPKSKWKTKENSDFRFDNQSLFDNFDDENQIFSSEMKDSKGKKKTETKEYVSIRKKNK